MANHLKTLLSEDKVVTFRRYFSVPDDVQLTLVGDAKLSMERADANTIVFSLLEIAEGGVHFSLNPFLRTILNYWGLLSSQPNVNFYRIVMGIVELNCRLNFNLGISTIQHCYALAKLSGRQRRYFLRAKYIDHHLVTMLSSFGKRVDDVMVAIRGNWELDEGEEHSNLCLGRRGESGNDLKNSLTFGDEAVLDQVKATLEYDGRSNLQGQGRVVHILLRYNPSYSTFTVVDHISIPRGEE
ncbi:hypothetical protein ACSBR2_042168 [Camellia fascicularis]